MHRKKPRQSHRSKRTGKAGTKPAGKVKRKGKNPGERWGHADGKKGTFCVQPRNERELARRINKLCTKRLKKDQKIRP